VSIWLGIFASILARGHSSVIVQDASPVSIIYDSTLRLFTSTKTFLATLSRRPELAFKGKYAQIVSDHQAVARGLPHLEVLAATAEGIAGIFQVRA
jgi:hypothetical protein